MAATKDATSGANPMMAFPNAHLATGGGHSVNHGAAPESTSNSPLELLRAAVNNENWELVYEEGKTKMRASAGWSADKSRCSTLQCLCAMQKATRVLEVGSFCGAAALAMAETIPKDGVVVAIELEEYFVEFGQKFRAKSQHGSKITTKVGTAEASLKALAEEVKSGEMKPFDFVVIDGDKAQMQQYLDLVNRDGLTTEGAVVCLDVTPFKGQPPTRYIKFGATEKWEQNSGESDIAAVREAVAGMPNVVSHEFGGLLVVQPQA